MRRIGLSSESFWVQYSFPKKPTTPSQCPWSSDRGLKVHTEGGSHFSSLLIPELGSPAGWQGGISSLAWGEASPLPPKAPAGITAVSGRIEPSIFISFLRQDLMEPRLVVNSLYSQEFESLIPLRPPPEFGDYWFALPTQVVGLNPGPPSCYPDTPSTKLHLQVKRHSSPPSTPPPPHPQQMLPRGVIRYCTTTYPLLTT